jgi:galactokinase
VNCKVYHSLDGGEYNVRRQRCEEGLNVLKRELNILSFRDINDAEMIKPFKSMMLPAVYDCCKYVIEEIVRTKKAALLLQQNDVKSFGKLMYETNEGLSKLYKVSCAELDFLVTLAKANNNVIGARLMGGGFGGCTINLVKETAVSDFIQQVTVAYNKQFNILPEAYVVETSDATGRIN